MTTVAVAPTVILLVEDNPADARLIRRLLRDGDAREVTIVNADRLGTALDRLRDTPVDLILLDLGLSDSTGLATFESVRKAVPDAPIIVLSRLEDERVALPAVRAGAQDYLVKGGVDGPGLARAIRYAIERKRAEREMAEVQARFRALVEHSWDTITVLDANGTITYASPATRRVLGYGVNEFTGRSAFELIAPEHRTFVAERMRESLRRPGEQVPVHANLLNKNGTWRQFEGIFTNLVDEPGVRGIVANIRDVTDQRRAEELVRWLTLAVEQGPSAVLMTDRDGKIEYVNRRFTEDTGYTAEDALGRNASLLRSGLTPQAQYELLWKTILAGDVYHGEVQNRTKAGRLYWNDLQLSPVRDGTGEISHFLGVQTDITDRKKAEQALRESGDRFRQLADNIDAVFFVMDARKFKTLYISPVYESMWGRSCSSLYADARSSLEALPAEDRERLLAHLRAIQHGEQSDAVEHRVIMPDGEERWMRSHAVPVVDADGTVYRVCGISQDITERHAAQTALEESLGRFRGIAAASFDAIGVEQDGVIREVNKGFLQIFGLALQDDAVGRPLADFLVLGSRADTARRIELSDEGTHEIVGLRKDGVKVLLEVTAKMHTLNGRPARIAAIRDVTEARALSQQFLQAQKMESIGQLAGGIAHDFNNLLTVILSYSDMVLADQPKSFSGRGELEEIRSAAKSAADLTRQLLAFSRKQILEPVVLNPNELVEKLDRMLRRLIGEDIDLRLVLKPDVGNVRVDPGQLEQVVVNLVVNARDAMPTGGSLVIETGLAELAGARFDLPLPAPEGPYVMLAVTDTGVGMDENLRTRIFEPFFTTKEKGRGTGLGLSTVYGIVKQSGGLVHVYSEPGRGSTFKVYLPSVLDAQERSGPGRVAVALVTGTETILLVEDNAALRKLAVGILQRLGYTVIAAEGAGPALLAARAHDGPIHLLLSDVVMPGTSGRDLALRLAEVRPDTKVLYMSGYTDDAIVRHGMLEPGLAFLQKPFTPRALGRKVREALDAS